MRILMVPALLTACLLASPALAKSMTGSELKAAFVGKPLKWQTADGKIRGTASYKADGSAAATGNFGSFTSDTGSWRINGNKLCVKWKKIRGGKERCYTVEAKGRGKFVDDGGTLISY
ncbi:MAG: hypothetical protein BroJett030_08610 [Alphaproteobacteria bacterium]|nr:MAG: hypothetical protein BroJett030_08610 [Alphaproteobacteria bacterium]